MSQSVSGTLYSDNGSTPDLTGPTLNVSINGAVSAGNTTASTIDGTYSIGGLTINSGDKVCVYLQGNTQKGFVVTIGTGSDLTGIDIYENNLNSRSDGGTMTNGNIHTATANAASGITAILASSTAIAITMAAGKTFYNMSGQTYAPGGNITAAGSFLNYGTYTTGTETVTLSGTSSYLFRSGGSTFHVIIQSGTGGTYTQQDALTTNSNLLGQHGTWDVSTNNYTLTCAGLSFGAANAWTFNARSGIVKFSGGGSFSVSTSTPTFYAIEFVGGTTTTIGSGSTSVSHSVTIDGGATFGPITFPVIWPAFSNRGTIVIRGGETWTSFTNDATHGTVNYIGNGTTAFTGLVGGNAYNNLIFNTASGSASYTLNATLTVNGSLTRTQGNVTDNGNAINVAGNWTNTAGAGAFTLTGTTILNGTNQTISGSTTFYNLTKTVSAADTLTFTDGTTQTVTNAVTLQGAAGQLLTLRGSSTAGWTISMPATQTLGYLNVSHSTATTNTAAAGSTSTDGGNNVNWTFGSAVALFRRILGLRTGSRGVN